MKIVFMGTPEFAIPIFKYLNDNHEVVAVVTQSDKPKGRGNKLTAPPVKELAIQYEIPVLQPEKLRVPEFEKELSEFNADLFVTAAYGKIIPENILKLPRYGCINVHASILPKYRGAAPLWWCIINGEKEAGVTTMFTDIGIDTGDMLLKKVVPIDDDMTMQNLHDLLSTLGAEVLSETLIKLEAGTLERIPQDNSLATYAPLITKEIGLIDWTKNARSINNLVRGTNPTPGAYTFINNERIKIWRTQIINEIDKEKQPGEIIATSSQGIDVATGIGVLRIIELQGLSSKKLTAGEYINGHPIDVGTILKGE